MSTDKKAKADRNEKRRQEEAKDRRSIAVYSVIGVAVVVAAIVLMIGSSGILQRTFAAQTIGGVKYTASDVQYFYNSVYTSYANNYAFDSGTSVKKQVYDQETGQSWHDFLMESAIETMTNQTALAAQAKSEGYELSEQARNELNTFLAQINSGWISYGYASRDDLVRASFGAHMTYDRLVELVNMEYLATDYGDAKLNAIEHTDADYEAYYQEHTDDLDSVTFSQFTFQATVPTTDEQGAPLELTDAEEAARLEEEKAAQKVLAEEVKAKLEGGQDPQTVADEYTDRMYSYSVSRQTPGSNLAYSTYGEWLLDSTRRTGDISLTERDSGSSYFYYVAVFEDRGRDEEPTNDVRHILVRAGSAASSEDPTQEQFDEAEQKAQALLDEWKAGEATEESFSALASANSADTSSASNGGLISNITSSSSYVETFRDWATDPARKEGDAELVKSEYGWHIMYYVSSNDPVWRQTVTAGLRSQDFEELAASASQGMTPVSGFGMRFVKA